MKPTRAILIACVLASGFAGGCGESSPSERSKEEQAAPPPPSDKLPDAPAPDNTIKTLPKEGS